MAKQKQTKDALSDTIGMLISIIPPFDPLLLHRQHLGSWRPLGVDHKQNRQFRRYNRFIQAGSIFCSPRTIFVGEGIQETIVLPEVEIDPLHHSPCDCMLSAAPVHA